MRVRLGRVSANGNGRVGSVIVTRGPGRPRIWAHDPCGRSHRGHGVAARGPLAARPLHERRRADPALDVRGAGLRARPRRCSPSGRAFLPTPRTDTGKTTTSLKILDSTPYSFLSDDLTLLTPRDGADLPQPLTISRHTLRAVKTRSCRAASALGSSSRVGCTPVPAEVRLRARQDPPHGSDDQHDRPAPRAAAEVPRGAAGAGRGRGGRGAARGHDRDRARRRGEVRLDERGALDAANAVRGRYGFPPYSPSRASCALATARTSAIASAQSWRTR